MDIEVNMRYLNKIGEIYKTNNTQESVGVPRSNNTRGIGGST